MSILNELNERSGSKCELCGSTEKLSVFQVPPVSIGGLDESLLACETCINQIENPDKMDSNHWRCLNDSMWSEFDSVKVIVWRMLHRLKAEGWPQDLLAMMYLDDATLKWAGALGDGKSEDEIIKHVDCNGALLEAGDTITITKDLDVKGGGNFTAKRGTAVRNISLVYDNAEQIEGKINGIQIVILTKFVKKST
jgi:protein PhnA